MKRLVILLSTVLLFLAACGEKKEESKEHASTSHESKSTSSIDAEKVKAKEKPKIKDNAVEINGVKVKITGTQVIPKGTTEYQRDDVLVVKYEVTNNSKADKDIKPALSYMQVFEAYQDSKDSEKRLEYGSVHSDDIRNERDKGDDIIKKGGTISSVETYKLTDLESPVLLKARDRENYEDPNIGTIKVNIKGKASSNSDKKEDGTTEL
ncbi:DUF5067 domain-containing protein [Staphylococcus simulans]